MDIPRSRGRTPPPSALPLSLALGALFLPMLAAAQSKLPTSAPVTDSSEAVAAACAIVLGLRARAPRPRCDVSGYEETPAEFVVRVREEGAPGQAPLLFDRSEVRFSKRERSVVVTREPEL